MTPADETQIDQPADQPSDSAASAPTSGEETTPSARDQGRYLAQTSQGGQAAAKFSGYSIPELEKEIRGWTAYSDKVTTLSEPAPVRLPQDHGMSQQQLLDMLVAIHDEGERGKVRADEVDFRKFGGNLPDSGPVTDITVDSSGNPVAIVTEVNPDTGDTRVLSRSDGTVPVTDALKFEGATIASDGAAPPEMLTDEIAGEAAEKHADENPDAPNPSSGDGDGSNEQNAEIAQSRAADAAEALAGVTDDQSSGAPTAESLRAQAGAEDDQSADQSADQPDEPGQPPRARRR